MDMSGLMDLNGGAFSTTDDHHPNAYGRYCRDVNSKDWPIEIQSERQSNGPIAKQPDCNNNGCSCDWSSSIGDLDALNQHAGEDDQSSVSTDDGDGEFKGCYRSIARDIDSYTEDSSDYSESGERDVISTISSSEDTDVGIYASDASGKCSSKSTDDDTSEETIDEFFARMEVASLDLGSSATNTTFSSSVADDCSLDTDHDSCGAASANTTEG